MSRPAVFFDRDGVVNVSPGAGYVLSWKQFAFSPGIIEALHVCKARGFLTVIVTSQQGVGKNLMSQAELDDIHARMQTALEKEGAAFDSIRACTCLAEDPGCTCRKPSPEMILAARDELDIDLTASWLIGDHDRDIQMAHHAGVHRTIRILNDDRPVTIEAAHTLPDVTGLADVLERVLPLC